MRFEMKFVAHCLKPAGLSGSKGIFSSKSRSSILNPRSASKRLAVALKKHMSAQRLSTGNLLCTIALSHFRITGADQAVEGALGLPFHRTHGCQPSRLAGAAQDRLFDIHLNRGLLGHIRPGRIVTGIGLDNQCFLEPGSTQKPDSYGP